MHDLAILGVHRDISPNEVAVNYQSRLPDCVLIVPRSEHDFVKTCGSGISVMNAPWDVHISNPIEPKRNNKNTAREQNLFVCVVRIMDKLRHAR